ncbi:MAG TPA: prepilin peptidase [Candidatus Portnoybacteria bacterium]|nr:prepilin peptidase [Candidatus Portnoybacteria bacterium]
MAEVLIFIFGLTIGSFLNVVICRLATGEEIVKSRSHCPHCGHVLSWLDLIPLLSFILLRRRCRYCQKAISLQYPLVEIITGALFVLAYKFVEPNSLFIFQLALNWYIAASLVVVFVYDLRHYVIPDKVLWPAIGAAFLLAISKSWLLTGGLAGFYPYLFSAFGAAAFFLSLVLITRGRGMGIGDIKLAFLMGLLLGWPGIFMALFLAFFIGAAAGVLLMLLGKKTMKSQIPFGPFLVFGTMGVYFAGERFFDWLYFLLGF